LYLYLLTNAVNGKQYVGITSRPVQKRLLEHLQRATTGTTHIARAIKKYGREAFTMKVIGEATDWAALCEAEQVAILSYNTFKPHGYNLTRGGEGVTGYEQSLEHRAKIGAAQQGALNHRYGKAPAPEHQAKMQAALAVIRRTKGDPRKGKPLSETHKVKLSLAGKGRKQAPEHIEQRRQAILGHEVSEETRAKLRTRALVQFATQGNPMQGKKHTEEAKQRMAAARLGKPAWNKGLKTGPLSEEHRVKLSVAHKGLPAWNKGLEAESLERREHESLKAFKRRKARYMDE
jgi:group I intron endonuclease